ncbi:MAG: nucleoside triphosphate pyrophosphatase [Candidatus Zixiibacteriota bacterium]
MTVRLPSFSKMICTDLRRLSKTVDLVLASGSPRRKKILTKLGIKFTVLYPDIEEKINSALRPDKLAVDLACQKVCSLEHKPNGAYLSCDTIVVYQNQILTKPRDKNDALRILKILSGQMHSVFTGLALYNSDSEQCLKGVEESRVTFNNWNESKLLEYIATGEPMDKAGAYGIQGMGRFLVDMVDGNIDNVIGLPLVTLEKMAKRFLESHV